MLSWLPVLTQYLFAKPPTTLVTCIRGEKPKIIDLLLSERSYTIKIYHIDNVASLTYHLCYLLHFLNPVSNSHICPLTLMKVKNSSMVHAERVCRQQNKCDWKIEISFEKGDRNGYQHFLLFLRHFQKTSFSRSGLFGKELTLTKKQNFRIVNAERFCRQQINMFYESRYDICLYKGRQHNGKQKKSILSFSHFLFRRPFSWSP